MVPWAWAALAQVSVPTTAVANTARARRDRRTAGRDRPPDWLGSCVRMAHPPIAWDGRSVGALPSVECASYSGEHQYYELNPSACRVATEPKLDGHCPLWTAA